MAYADDYWLILMVFRSCAASTPSRTSAPANAQGGWRPCRRPTIDGEAWGVARVHIEVYI